jgi:hypothetical protein
MDLEDLEELTIDRIRIRRMIGFVIGYEAFVSDVQSFANLSICIVFFAELFATIGVFPLFNS